jgi:hypothetical protein
MPEVVFLARKSKFTLDRSIPAMKSKFSLDKSIPSQDEQFSLDRRISSQEEQIFLRQKYQTYSQPGRANSHDAEVFPPRKNLNSNIPGFPAGDRDHSLTFLTV